MGGVGPLVVVEGDPAPDAGLGLRPGFPGIQVDAFILERPPQAFNEVKVQRRLALLRAVLISSSWGSADFRS